MFAPPAALRSSDCRAALHAIGDLALPRSCAGCDASGVALCRRCRAALADALAEPAFVARPRPCPPGFPATWSQVPYDGVVAALLRAFKDSGRADVGPPLALLLRSALAAAVAHDDGAARALRAGRRLRVVPMPSRASSTRARGREPTLELGRRALARLPPLALRRVLRVASTGRDQAGLSAVERTRNISGAMRLSVAGRRLVAGRVCVVIDDIVTTGSSLAEARAALVDGGAEHVLAATVAATQRHVGASAAVPAGCPPDGPFTGVGPVV
ncbi:ComF family protein [Flexivirga sp.]|uniref:ComF family protein n=1 Tax=Flexivirga sp. TaxID=1962927 RepID=UPI003F7EB2A3